MLHTLALVTSETIDQFIGRVLKLLQALEIRADRPQPQTTEGIEYHVLKALPEKAYQYFNQKVRSATDKPKDEQEARPAFFPPCTQKFCTVQQAQCWNR
jgi:hypothetical protein